MSQFVETDEVEGRKRRERVSEREKREREERERVTDWALPRESESGWRDGNEREEKSGKESKHRGERISSSKLLKVYVEL